MSPAKSESYIYAGQHPQDLADGRTLAPGAIISFSASDLEDPHNARLLEEGLLIKDQKPDKEALENSNQKEIEASKFTSEADEVGGKEGGSEA